MIWSSRLARSSHSTSGSEKREILIFLTLQATAEVVIIETLRGVVLINAVQERVGEGNGPKCGCGHFRVVYTRPAFGGRTSMRRREGANAEIVVGDS